MRFNSPPNWPAPPPGWTPPPDWQPDPSWPPPPPGWQFWVADSNAHRNRTGLIIGGTAAAVAVVAIIAVVVLTTRDSKPSDEEQIRAVVAGMEDAWNSSDYQKFRGFVCEDSLAVAVAPTEDEFKEQRKGEGRIELEVKGVEITDDEAIVEVEEIFAKDEDSTDTEDLELVRENGEWKACFT